MTVQLSLWLLRVQGKLVVPRQATQQHLLWLTFADQKLEREFGAWHSLQLSKVPPVPTPEALPCV